MKKGWKIFLDSYYKPDRGRSLYFVSLRYVLESHFHSLKKHIRMELVL